MEVRIIILRVTVLLGIIIAEIVCRRVMVAQTLVEDSKILHEPDDANRLWHAAEIAATRERKL